MTRIPIDDDQRLVIDAQVCARRVQHTLQVAQGWELRRGHQEDPVGGAKHAERQRLVTRPQIGDHEIEMPPQL